MKQTLLVNFNLYHESIHRITKRSELVINELNWINLSSSRVNNLLSVSDSNIFRICTKCDKELI